MLLEVIMVAPMEAQRILSNAPVTAVLTGNAPPTDTSTGK